MHSSPETKINTELTTSDEVLVPKKRSTKRKLGHVAVNPDNLGLDAFLKQCEATEQKKMSDGELFKVSVNREKEITTPELDGRTGLVLEAKNDKGDRYVYVQEYAEKGIESLKDKLTAEIPENARIERAVILTPESNNKKGFSKDDEFLDYLSLAINYASLIRNQDSNSVVQAITYKKEQSPGDYNPVAFKIKCLENGQTEVYSGNELIDPNY